MAQRILPLRREVAGSFMDNIPQIAASLPTRDKTGKGALQTEEGRAGPVQPADGGCHLGQGSIALATILKPVVKDHDSVGGATPFPDQLGAGLQRRRAALGFRIGLFKGVGQCLKTPQRRLAQTPEGFFLDAMGDEPGQNIPAHALWHWYLILPPPDGLETRNRQFAQFCQLLAHGMGR